MSLSSSYLEQASALTERLGRGLPFPVHVADEQPCPDHPYHRVIKCQASHGIPTDIYALLSCEIAFVTDEGRRKGYHSGVADMSVHHEFGGLGIGKILARNILLLFKAQGELSVPCNTDRSGTAFWTSLGWLPMAQGELIESEDVMSDDFRHFKSWPQLYESMMDRVGFIGIEREYYDAVRMALSVLDRDDPESLWQFLDLKTMIRRQGDSNETTLALHVLYKQEARCTFDLYSNVQMKRFAQKTDDAKIDPAAYAARRSAYVSRIERNAFWERVLEY